MAVVTTAFLALEDRLAGLRLLFLHLYQDSIQSFEINWFVLQRISTEAQRLVAVIIKKWHWLGFNCFDPGIADTGYVDDYFTQIV